MNFNYLLIIISIFSAFLVVAVSIFVFIKTRSGVKLYRKTSLIVPILFICTMLIVTATQYAFFKLENIDQSTLCQIDGEKINETVLFIDFSDPLSGSQFNQVHQHIYNIAKKVEKGDKLTIYSRNSTNQKLEPLLSKCNPGSGANAGPFLNNPKLLEKRYEQEYLAELRKVIDRITSLPSNAENSPILESILEISKLKFTHKPNIKYNLVIISDMLQHSSNYSAYNQFQNKLSKLEVKRLAANLSGVDVQIYVIIRQGYKRPQNEHLADFWDEYFRAANVSSIKYQDIR